MRSATFRAKKPVWVRIVNPDPIRILDMTWRYGEHVRIAPGGAFHTISSLEPAGRDRRVLAMYRPPCAPSSHDDAPPDALVLLTLEDLRLVAEGVVSFIEKYDDSVASWPSRALEPIEVRPGETAGVPRPRVVRAMYPPTVHERLVSRPYRESVEVEFTHRRAERRTIRPGGTLRVFVSESPTTPGYLRVRYQANPDCPDEQCETGAWFYLPARDFLRMKDEAAAVAECEALETVVVRCLLSQVP